MKNETVPSVRPADRLPLRAVARMQKASEKQEPVMTFPRMHKIRVELQTVLDGCQEVERVLDQSETVFRLDDLKDLPGFRAELSRELRAKLFRMADSIALCLEKFKGRI